MSQKLHGALNLSKIPKELITTNRAGDRVLWIDIVERRSKGQYGETHSVTCYDKNRRQAIYLADLTPQEFGSPVQPQQPAPAAQSYRSRPAAQQSAPAPAPAEENGDDLPF